MKQYASWLSTLSLTVALAACGTSPNVDEPQPNAQAPQQTQGLARQSTGQQRPPNPLTPKPNSNRSMYNPGMAGDFERLAEREPGFAGFILNQDGELHVYTAPAGNQARAERAAQELALKVQERRNRSQANAAVTPDLPTMAARTRSYRAQYNYRQLSDWRNLLRTQVFDEDTFSMMTVSIPDNAILIGTTEERGWERMRGIAARLKIPPQAIKLVVRPRAQSVQLSGTLDNEQSTFVGGLQIYTEGILGCTLGLNINMYDQFGGSGKGFLTNSHCTTYLATADYREHFQGPQGSMNVVGYEHTDPATFGYETSALCSGGVPCRWSDSAFVLYYSWAAANSPFAIARTTNRVYSGYGSLSINTSSPQLRVFNEYGIYLGDPMEKIGQTSGWTYGTAQNVCVDALPRGAGEFVRLCQIESDMDVFGGDSGSPVFYRTDTNNVEALGLVWGSTMNDAQTVSYASYSSDLASIRRDFYDYAGYDFQVASY
ncbi:MULTISPECIES: hypothetical protein [Deinococcus]|uniref:hypothetical protein n=1 Tax=Deinococcus TaxID=1298 RepID=UPI000A924E65|nr:MULTISPECIES: hypothetical protein [Deinococcus]